MNNSDEIS